MAKKANQKLKLLYLAKILQEKTDDEHGMSLKQIISALDSYGISAERKSLYDDFSMLNEFGYDIEKDGEGSKTVYYIAEREFEFPELKLLVDSVQTSRFISKKKSERLIKKLEALTSEHQARELNREVYVQNRIKSQNELALHIIDAIHNAINSNKKISFLYYDWDENKKKKYRHNGKVYVVSPWRLMISEDKYYLLSYDEEVNDIKTFKINKMEKVTVLDSSRSGEKVFKSHDMAKYENRSFSMYGGELKRVTLNVKKTVLNVLTDRFGIDDITIIPKDNETVDVVVNVYVSPTFYSWVSNFGSNIEVMTPKDVRQEYISFLKKALERYE